MTAEHAHALDNAIAGAILDRIKTASERDIIEADLDRLRRLHARGSTRFALVEALRFLLQSMANGDPNCSKFESELHGLSDKKENSAPDKNEAEWVVPIPEWLPEIELVVSRASLGTAWPVPPLFEAHWRELSNPDLLKAVRLARACFPHDLSAEDAAAALSGRATELPHYPGFRAIDILFQDKDLFKFSHIALYSAENAILINGKSSCIHKLNSGDFIENDDTETRRSPLKLTTLDEAAAYLRFFCGCVHGDEGPFTIIESSDQLRARWKGTEMPDEIREKISALQIQPETTKKDGKATEPFDNQAEYTRGSGAVEATSNRNAAADTSGNAFLSEKAFHNMTWTAFATVLYSNALFSARFRIMPTGNVKMIDDDLIKAGLPILRDGFVYGVRVLP